MTDVATPPTVERLSAPAFEPLLRPGITERFLATLTIFVLIYGIPSSWFQTRADVIAGSTNPLLVLLTLALIGIGVMRILGSIDLLIRVVQLEPALFAFVGLMMASTFWSINTYLTARWSILLFATTLYALYLFMRFDLSEILTMFGIASLFGAIACLVMIFAFPQYGLDPGSGEWNGVFAQKNALGYTASITIPSMLVLDRAAPRWRWMSRLVLLMHVPMLIGSNSKTMFVATGLTVGLLFFYKAFRARKTMRGAVMVALGSTTVFSIVFATANLALLARWLEKDVTLTGRTVLWAALIDPIKQHFWLGNGYSVSFTDPFGPLFEVFNQVPFEASHAHNAFLQIILDAGVFGLALYLWLFIRALSRATEVTRRVPGMLGLWPLTILTTVQLISISEPGVTGGGFGWLLLVLAVLYSRHGRGAPLIAEQEEARHRQQHQAVLDAQQAALPAARDQRDPSATLT